MVVSNAREILERPRIRDVATLAGTSVSTVSNLLNGRPDRMRPETVRRIEEAIEQLGYRPSWAARQLKTGFSPVIGLLVPSVANPSHGAMARAVEVAAQARGYQVVLGNSLRDPARERQYAEDFFDFGIRGVIVGSSPFDLGHFSELRSRGLFIVAFDLVTTGEGEELAMDSVSVDNRRAGYLATRHLIELGHRRIGYISGTMPTMSRRDRLEGYRQALAEAGIPADPELIAAGEGALGHDDTHAAEHGRAAAREPARACRSADGARRAERHARGRRLRGGARSRRLGSGGRVGRRHRRHLAREPALSAAHDRASADREAERGRGRHPGEPPQRRRIRSRRST